MEIQGKTRLFGVAVLVAIAGVAVAGSASGGEGERELAEPWMWHAGTVSPDGGWRGGPKALVPDRACAIAVGGVNEQEQREGSWAPDETCTRLTEDRQPGPPPDGPPNPDRVEMRDAVQDARGWLAVGTYTDHGDAYASRGMIWRGTPGARWGVIGRLDPKSIETGQVLLNAVAATPTGLIAGGGVRDDGSVDRHAAVWLSTSGDTWTQVRLPVPTGAGDSTVADLAVVGGQFVAVGEYHAGPTYDTARPAFWTSRDGQLWRLSVDNAASNGESVTAVAKTQQGWAAAGGDPAHGTAWTSTDGVTWRRHVQGLTATGPLTAVAVDRSGTVVLVGPTNASGTCASAWSSTGRRPWHGESLGCTGVPPTLAALPDGRLIAASGAGVWERAAS